VAVVQGTVTPIRSASRSTTASAICRQVVSLPPTMLNMLSSPSRLAWSSTVKVRLTSRVSPSASPPPAGASAL
jgi:hypothetical protein